MNVCAHIVINPSEICSARSCVHQNVLSETVVQEILSERSHRDGQEMIEDGFLAIIWLFGSMLLGKILDEEEYYVLFSGIEACYAMTIYCVYFKLVRWRVSDVKLRPVFYDSLMALLADQQLPNGLLYIIEAGIDLALLSDNAHQGETWDGDDNGNEIEKRVAQLLNDDEINMEYKEAFRQQTIIGWGYIFTGNIMYKITQLHQDLGTRVAFKW